MIKKLYILRVVPQSLDLEQLKNQITAVIKQLVLANIFFLHEKTYIILL